MHSSIIIWLEKNIFHRVNEDFCPRLYSHNTILPYLLPSLPLRYKIIKHRKKSHSIIHFSKSSGIHEVSAAERASEVGRAEQVNE